MLEAKAFRTKKTAAYHADDEWQFTLPLNYLVSQNDGVAYVATEEFSQKIAAALNLFDAMLEMFGTFLPKEEPDNFQQYIIAGSWIAKAGYDSKKRKLRVYKLDGTCITHLDVPPEIAFDFIRAESAGAFYNKNIRGKFPKEEKE